MAPTDDRSEDADVGVLGGGVVGTACAWRAAQRGLRVVLVDPSPGSGASGAAAGMLAPVSELHHGEEALLRLGLHAAEAYPRYVADVEAASGADSGYRECGTLVVALEADDRARLVDVRASQQRLGLDVEALTGRACRRLEPLLDPGVSGGTLARGDHQVDPAGCCARCRQPPRAPASASSRRAGRCTWRMRGPRGCAWTTARCCTAVGSSWPPARARAVTPPSAR